VVSPPWTITCVLKNASVRTLDCLLFASYLPPLLCKQRQIIIDTALGHSPGPKFKRLNKQKQTSIRVMPRATACSVDFCTPKTVRNQPSLEPIPNADVRIFRPYTVAPTFIESNSKTSLDCHRLVFSSRMLVEAIPLGRRWRTR